eukprot:UN00890
MFNYKLFNIIPYKCQPHDEKSQTKKNKKVQKCTKKKKIIIIIYDLTMSCQSKRIKDTF